MASVTRASCKRRAVQGVKPPSPRQASSAGPASALAEALPMPPQPSRPQIRNVVVTARLVQMHPCMDAHGSCDSNSLETAAAAAAAGGSTATATGTHSDINLPLHEMAQTMYNAEYNPKRFAALIVRMREPSSTALIFRTGKMVCTGNKTVADARLACARHAKAVATVVASLNRRREGCDDSGGGGGGGGGVSHARNGRIGGESGNSNGTVATTAMVNIKPVDIAVQNVVATVNVPWSLELQALATHPEHRQRVSFEPEIFGGLIYRMRTPKVSCLIFMNGKCVLVGAKSARDVDDGFEKLVAILRDRRFRRDNGSSG